MDGFSPVKRKCLYWRESLNEDDKWNPRLKPGQRHVDCTCFVEGDRWQYLVDEVPANCPMSKSCRYYIKFE